MARALPGVPGRQEHDLHAAARLRRQFGPRNLVAAIAMCLASLGASTASAQQKPEQFVASGRSIAMPDGWITDPAIQELGRPVVLHFRRAIELHSRPQTFPVRVSADNNFILFVNGRRVAAGPSTSDAVHWRYQSIDLAIFLKAGQNVVSATVWNYVRSAHAAPANATEAEKAGAWANEMMIQSGRLAQISLATGLWLDGSGRAAEISTRLGGWEVASDPGRSAGSGAKQIGLGSYYVASAPETIDTRSSLDPGDVTTRARGAWHAAAPASAASRELVPDGLPPQRFELVPSGKLVRTTLGTSSDFPAQKVTIPARSRVALLIQRDAMVSAYPELLLSGGNGAKIRMTYAEALYDQRRRKGDRNEIGDRKAFGITDEIIADGSRRSVMPLWWRTWRYLEINVETDDAPLVLEGLKTWETGYPFEARGYFRSSDLELDRIWQVGWRTALVDAHDTYMDSAYWEQLQYVGDTRLQMLISYAVSGDPRLAVQAIDAFAASNVDDGLIEGAWPSRGTNSIAPFSLLWIGMLHDWMAEQPDTAPVVRNLPRMREVLRWFDAWRGTGGLLLKNPQWNFIDWVGQSASDRKIFPSWGGDGESCLTSVSLLGALRQAAEIEDAAGDPNLAAANRSKAESLRNAIRVRCWSPERRLFADNPDKAVFSQHMNALAILYDVATRDEAPDLLDRIIAPGRGINAPEGMYTSSYYFAWYLVRALEHAGQVGRYPQLLATWRDLLKLNFTTWPEERGDTRSDTHAWSAHPTADLLRLVAGIGPGAPGYRTVRIAPSLGDLTRLDAAAMTPAGLVSVSYRVDRGTLHATLRTPPALGGTFVWQGRSYPLTGRKTVLRIAAADTGRVRAAR